MSGAVGLPSAGVVPERSPVPAELPAPRHSYAPRFRLLVASTAAGAVGGLIGAGYLLVLHWLTALVGPEHHVGLARCALLAGTGMVICALLATLGDPGETGVLVDSVHVAGGPDRVRPLLSLVPISLMTIGGGGGIGPEPPLMQTTGTVATWIGRRLRVSRPELRVLTVTGMAAGLTVLFAAPLGGAVFALELLHRKGLEYYEALIPACVGSLAGFCVYAGLTGRDLGPTWRFPDADTAGPPLAVLLLIGVAAGVGGALVAYVFAALIKTCRRLAAQLPAWARPVAAGLALAALGCGLPDGLTFGETQLGALAHTTAPAAWTLLLIAAGHLLSAAITLAGRWKGGVIIPMFLVGYCLGRLATLTTGHHRGYVVAAVCMMAACNVGMTKTPLGTTLVVAQMTGVATVPPILIAALVSLALSSRVAFIGGQRHRDASLLHQGAHLR